MSEKTSFNPLSNKKIVVKPKLNMKNGITDKSHPLYGGMLDIAVAKFYAKRHPNGGYYSPFTDEERLFVSEVTGIEEKTMRAAYKGADCYWDTYHVELPKTGDILDMRSVEDFIKLKVLLTNTGLICSDQSKINDKASYRYYIVDEGSEVEQRNKSLSSKTEAYVSYSKIEKDKYKLAYIVWQLSNRLVSESSELKTIKAQLDGILESNIEKFNTIVKDKLFSSKVLINKAVMNAVIARKDEEYYMDEVLIVGPGKNGTLTNTAAYISDKVNQEVKYKIEDRVNTALGK